MAGVTGWRRIWHGSAGLVLQISARLCTFAPTQTRPGFFTFFSMIYPIVAYGDPVLRQEARDLTPEDQPELSKLVADMYETMYNASGVGLAAPQLGLNIRLFVIDAGQMEEELTGYKKVFVNARILEERGDPWAYEEGCLSIPGIRGDVYRKPIIRIRYQDENWQWHEEEFDGIVARIIQHEYDHIQGVLFTDHLSMLKRSLIKNRLTNITKGKVEHEYRMKFYGLPARR